MTCSDDAWHGLWTAFNKHTTETIRVDRAQLGECVRCAGGMPDDLLATTPREGSKTVEVNRTALFSFLNRHGAVCA